MAKRKRTVDSTSLNSFRESIVKTISASVSYNSDGRSVVVRTLQTADGEQHTFTNEIPSELALKAVEDVFSWYKEWMSSVGSKSV